MYIYRPRLAQITPIVPLFSFEIKQLFVKKNDFELDLSTQKLLLLFVCTVVLAMVGVSLEKFSIFFVSFFNYSIYITK